MQNEPNDLQIRGLISSARLRRAEALAEGIADVITGVGKVLGFLVAPLTRLLERDRIEMQLQAMSDYELADLGVSRSDIHAIAEGTYHSDRSMTHQAANSSEAIRPAAAA